MQRYSIFHATSEETLKAWHRPYADLFRESNSVLDVGCGPGYFGDLLRERSVRHTGLDLDPEMVAATKARGHTAYEGDQRLVANLGAKFDGIHISHVVEHLWGDELVNLVEQCAASLSPGGVLVIRTPNWGVAEVRRHVFWMDHTHKRPYALEVLQKILLDNGFTVQSSGEEPYGLKDLYVIGTAPGGVEQGRNLAPAFKESPFPKPSITARIRGRLAAILRG